jgi:hypothetical protein
VGLRIPPGAFAILALSVENLAMVGVALAQYPAFSLSPRGLFVVLES